ncbi:MAG: hypothetical protein NTW94_01615 [Legionellales bacterium]|nr:hypothetical protein [Legionellales bacterium]
MTSSQGFRGELLCLVFLLLIGNLYTHDFMVKHPQSSVFYQNEFAPSVMLACGYDFANPAVKTTQLDGFN